MWAILFFLPSLICAAEDFKRPKFFFVFGEHRSGASYLSELIRSNTHPHDIQDCYLLNSHNEKGSSQHHMIHSSTRRPDTHNIPNFDDFNINQQLRFITLIDIIYEKKISLMTLMASDFKDLGSSAKLADPFKRTLSRLYELTSSSYN